ncbi:MAG: hypothetical protein ACJ749_17690 [Flavisolibacter sp.]
MQKLLLIVLLFCCEAVFAQRGMIFIKRREFKKVATFNEGDPIKFTVIDGFAVTGFIWRVSDDSINVSGNVYHKNQIKAIIIREKSIKPVAKQLVYATIVAGAIVGMMTLTGNQEEDMVPKAAIICYTPVVFKSIGLLKRKQYKIGKKFSIQTIDLHFTPKPLL